MSVRHFAADTRRAGPRHNTLRHAAHAPQRSTKVKERMSPQVCEQLRSTAATSLDAAGKWLRKASRTVAPPAAPEPSAEELRDRWGRWLQRCSNDIIVLHGHQGSWDELRAVVDANIHIPVPNHVMDFVADLYAIVIAVGVRRQADRADDVANLRRLIDDVARHPAALPREWFVARYPEFMRDQGERDFDKFTKPGGAFVDPAIIRDDLARLGAIGARVKRYVDQHLAHSAENLTAPIPKYSDLRECLSGLDQLLRRYYLLVDGGGLTSSTPTMQYNFQLPLIVPWAPNDALLQYLRRDGQLASTDVERAARNRLAAGQHATPAEQAALLATIDALRAEVAARPPEGS